MRAVVISAPGEVGVMDVADPAPRAGEVLVRVGACGICGTDLHLLDGDSPLTHYPIVPGHEFAGEVVALGSGVTERDATLVVGSRVAVEPNLYCGYCEPCRTGHENLCLNYDAIGVTRSGAMAQFVSVPITKVYALPDDISLRAGALIEPLSCAVHGLHRLQPRSGDSVLIVGAGTMGVLLLQLAVRGGASQVVMVDVNMKRLELAERLGAKRGYSSIEFALHDNPRRFDCVVDATGVAPVMESAFTAVKRGGKFMVFGVASPQARISLSPFRIYNEEITVLGSMAVLDSFQPALDLLGEGIIDTEAMLTSALPLEDFSEALALVRRGEGVKTQVLPNS
jgi:2-desacetyl-2-hydroxyethyl bacteriochlorophyllide A dehydrogenase